jgi:hypothetical protein
MLTSGLRLRTHDRGRGKNEMRFFPLSRCLFLSRPVSLCGQFLPQSGFNLIEFTADQTRAHHEYQCFHSENCSICSAGACVQSVSSGHCFIISRGFSVQKPSGFPNGFVPMQNRAQWNAKQGYTNFSVIEWCVRGSASRPTQTPQVPLGFNVTSTGIGHWHWTATKQTHIRANGMHALQSLRSLSSH